MYYEYCAIKSAGHLTLNITRTDKPAAELKKKDIQLGGTKI